MQLYKLFPTGKENDNECNFIFAYACIFFQVDLRGLESSTTMEEDMYLLNLSLVYCKQFILVYGPFSFFPLFHSNAS